MASEKGILSGSGAMLILRLLEEKDMYGYEMIESLAGRSNHIFDLKAGTLYPLLHGLEEQGCLESYERNEGGKLRRYYSLTKKGGQMLKEKKEEWVRCSGIINEILGV